MINGEEYSFYGLVPIAHFGFLDMPSRIGETFYDWGEYIEPLVHEKDISWDSRALYIDCFFDRRLTNLSFRESISSIVNQKGYMSLINRFGDFEVKLKEVKKIKDVGNSKVIYRLFFTEKEQIFVTDIPLAIGGDNYLIDGYSLKNDFGVLVSEVITYDNYASLKSSTITTSNSYKPLTDFRGFKTIELKCIALKRYDYILKINLLKSILSNSGTRTLEYNGVSFNCFLSEGFNSIITGKVSFNLKLNIINQTGSFNNETIDASVYNQPNERKFLETLFEYPLFKTGFSQ